LAPPPKKVVIDAGTEKLLKKHTSQGSLIEAVEILLMIMTTSETMIDQEVILMLTLVTLATHVEAKKGGGKRELQRAGRLIVTRTLLDPHRETKSA
jgi:hypothetical protein